MTRSLEFIGSVIGLSFVAAGFAGVFLALVNGHFLIAALSGWGFFGFFWYVAMKLHEQGRLFQPKNSGG